MTDQETIAAFNAFQGKYGLEVKDWLSSDQMAVLEALAFAQSGAKNTQQDEIVADAGTEGTERQSDVPDMAGVEEGSVVRPEPQQCGHERGLAALTYGYLKQRAEVEISELCFNRENGELVSLESASGLTLVENLDGSDMFEIIVPGTQTHERTHLSAQRFGPGPDDWTRGYSGSISYLPNWPTPNRRNAHSLSMFGFAYGGTSARSEIGSGEFEVSLTATDSWSHHDRRYGVRGGETPIAIIGGRTTFNNGAAQLTFETDEGSDGSGGGTVDLIVDEDGRITGSGAISMTNTRLTGAHPHDWKSMNWKISDFKGMFVGPYGQEFRGIGLVSGETIDHDGFVHRASGHVSISGFGAKLRKRWAEYEASKDSD